MAQKDQFADLLSSFSGKKNQNVEKMSLAERLRQSQQSTPVNLNNSWSGLDLLGSIAPSKPSQTAQSMGSGRDDDDFSIFDTTSSISNVKPASNVQLDDIFMSSDNSTPQSMGISNSGNLLDDDFTDAFVEEPALLPQDTHINTVPAPEQSIMYRKDELISELVEMGFDFDVAKRALSQTANYDVNEAISVIMNEAHAKSKPKQHHQLKQQQFMDQDELSQLIQDLTVDIKSKLFSLLSKGRKTLAKGIEIYKDQQFNNTDNQPVWMRNQAQYKQGSMQLEGDEDEEELDKEQMRRIVDRQRAMDKQLKEEKMRRLDEQKSGSKSPTQRRNHQEQVSKFDEPAPRRRVERSRSNFEEPIKLKPQPLLRKPEQVQQKASISKFDEPVSRRRQTSTTKIEPITSSKFTEPKPRSQPRETPKMEESFDIFNSTTSLVPDIPISSFQLTNFQHSRNEGNELFKNGDFTNALLKYQDSLANLPTNHKLRVISLSNISNTFLKLGNPKESLNSIEEALQVIETFNCEIGDYTKIEIEKGKFLKPLWLKLISRKAESLELLEKFKDSLAAYNLCIESGGSTKAVLDGRRRVNGILNPKPVARATPKPSPKPTREAPKPKGENTKKIESQNLNKEREELEKFQLYDQVDLRVQNWKLGKEDNLRALLSSLDQVLWPELGWKPLSISDLVLNQKVKINYLKAVAKTHPDKLINCTTEQKMIAQNVFVILNQSWDKFKEANNM